VPAGIDARPAWPRQTGVHGGSCPVRAIDGDEGQRLLRIVRRDSGSVVTWRRAQLILLSAQGMPAAKIAEVTFASPDRVRDVIHNFNADGFDSLYPWHSGGRPRKFTLPERREIKKMAKSKPAGRLPTARSRQRTASRRYIIWRNQHAADERLHRIVERANAA
jgi:transposase